MDRTLSRPSTRNVNVIKSLPYVECNVLLDDFPTVTETAKAIQHLSSGKVPGSEATPAKIYNRMYRAGGQPMTEKLTELFHCMSRTDAIPQEFKDASIITYASGKEMFKSVTTIQASLYC